MKRRFINKVHTFLAVMTLVAAVLMVPHTVRDVRAASPGEIIINEMMYNPGTGNQLDEYLELYNTTSGDISAIC